MIPFWPFVLKTVSDLFRWIHKWIGLSDLPDTVRHSMWYSRTSIQHLTSEVTCGYGGWQAL